MTLKAMNPSRNLDQVSYAAPTGRRARMSEGSDFWWRTDQPPTSPKLRALRDHWLALRGDRALPPRGALDPLDIPALLPHIVLVDVLREPVRFRYRLVGTFVTGLAGRDATGRFLDRALYGRYLDAMIWPHQEVVRTSAPVATLSGVLFAERDWHCVENLFVPFGANANAGDGGEVDLIATCVDVDANKLQRDLSQGLVLDWRG